jgi:hypothetical protein
VEGGVEGYIGDGRVVCRDIGSWSELRGDLVYIEFLTLGQFCEPRLNVLLVLGCHWGQFWLYISQESFCGRREIEG